MRKFLKSIIKHTGVRIPAIFTRDYYRLKDPFRIQKQLIQNSNRRLTIFDVGAFVGRVALRYNDLFPNSHIYCFEPFPDSFNKLKSNTSSLENIVLINKGVGEHLGKSVFHCNQSGSTNSILATQEDGDEIWGNAGLLRTEKTINIELETLDHFVKTHKIDKIDILKIDVQGAEHMVINGAKNTLEKGIVQLIYTEIITLPTYKGQKQIDEIISLIRSYGFDLFNLYNATMTSIGQLRQVDVIFINSKIKSIDSKCCRN